MKLQKIIFGLGIVIITCFSLAPHTVRAVSQCNGTDLKSGEYCLLEPLQVGDTPLDRIDATSIAGYINILFKIIIGIVGVLAVIMLVLGGVQYMSTDAISGKEAGKETITRSIGGLILALASFMILNTINPKILSLNLDSINPLAVSVSTEDLAPQAVVTAEKSDGSGASVNNLCPQSPYLKGTAIVDQMAWPSDSIERGQITSGTGININKDNCTKVVDKKAHPDDPALSCTTVLQLPSSVITNLKTVKTKCDTFNGGSGKCSLTITGGTECWQHATHGLGLAPLDISATDSFTAYVLGDKTKTTFPNNNVYYDRDGHSYRAEKADATTNTTGKHWHMKN